MDAKSLAGTIRHRGGIALTRGQTVVRLSDFDIVIDERPSLAAALNGGSPKAEILSLDVSGLTGPTIAARTVTVGGVVAKLTATGAAALNQAFSTSAFSEGLVLGTATVRGAI